MAKKLPVPKKPATEASRQLVDAIVTVKHLQSFVAQHGSLDKALEAVSQVQRLIELTGGFDALRQALEIVGKEEAPAQQ